MKAVFHVLIHSLEHGRIRVVDGYVRAVLYGIVVCDNPRGIGMGIVIPQMVPGDLKSHPVLIQRRRQRNGNLTAAFDGIEPGLSVFMECENHTARLRRRVERYHLAVDQSGYIPRRVEAAAVKPIRESLRAVDGRQDIRNHAAVQARFRNVHGNGPGNRSAGNIRLRDRFLHVEFGARGGIRFPASPALAVIGFDVVFHVDGHDGVGNIHFRRVIDHEGIVAAFVLVRDVVCPFRAA